MTMRLPPEIAGAAAPPPGLSPPPAPDHGAFAVLQLQAELQIMGRAMQQLGAASARRARLAQAVRFLDPAPVLYTVTGGALVQSNTDLPGPNDGYFWAVQRLNVTGIGGNDVIALYKGPGTPSAVQQQAGPLFTAAAPFYHPGKTGLLLNPKESLALQASGALAATSQVYLTMTVLNIAAEFIGDLLI